MTTRQKIFLLMAVGFFMAQVSWAATMEEVLAANIGDIESQTERTHQICELRIDRNVITAGKQFWVEFSGGVNSDPMGYFVEFPDAAFTMDEANHALVLTVLPDVLMYYYDPATLKITHAGFVKASDDCLFK